jgi:hypothetical protein
MTASTCRDSRLVDAHFEGRISPDGERALRAHLGSCADCTDRYRSHLVYARLDRRALPAAERLGRALGLPGRRPRLWPWGVPALALVSALALLLVIGRLETTGGQLRPRGAATGAVPHLLVYRLSPGTAPHRVMDSISAGDELAFAYTNPGGRGHVMIFAVDQQRRVFWYHPAWAAGQPPPRALPAAAGLEAHELQDAISHDLAPGQLRIYGLFSDDSPGAAEVETAVASGRTLAEVFSRASITERVLEVRP